MSGSIVLLETSQNSFPGYQPSCDPHEELQLLQGSVSTYGFFSEAAEQSTGLVAPYAKIQAFSSPDIVLHCPLTGKPVGTVPLPSRERTKRGASTAQRARKIGEQRKAARDNAVNMHRDITPVDHAARRKAIMKDRNLQAERQKARYDRCRKEREQRLIMMKRNKK